MFSLALVLVKQYHYKIHPVMPIKKGSESFFSERRGSEVDHLPIEIKYLVNFNETFKSSDKLILLYQIIIQQAYILWEIFK